MQLQVVAPKAKSASTADSKVICHMTVLPKRPTSVLATRAKSLVTCRPNALSVTKVDLWSPARSARFLVSIVMAHDMFKTYGLYLRRGNDQDDCLGTVGPEMCFHWAFAPRR
jgi:hypothetical protein